MATTIHLNFGDFTFSSAVEYVTVRTDAASVGIALHSLAAGFEDLVFSETYYPYNGSVTLHDLASIIEADMVNSEQSLAKYRIVATAADGTSATKEFSVLYCDRHAGQQPYGIVSSQFLSSRRVITATRDIPIPLFYVRPPVEYIDQELVSAQIICRRHDNGEIRLVFHPLGYTGYGTDYELNRLTIDSQTLLAAASERITNTGFDLVGVTVNIGSRSITIYYTDRCPDLRLWFRNMFNCPELAELTGDTTAKTKVKRSEAVCGGTVSLYDRSAEQTFEFQAGGLSLDTARWLTELFASRDVRIVNRAYTDEDFLDEGFPPVLITDSTSEAQDGDDELNKIKFTYRHPSVRPDSGLSVGDRIHTEPFKAQFN